MRWGGRHPDIACRDRQSAYRGEARDPLHLLRSGSAADAVDRLAQRLRAGLSLPAEVPEPRHLHPHGAGAVATFPKGDQPLALGDPRIAAARACRTLCSDARIENTGALWVQPAGHSARPDLAREYSHCRELVSPNRSRVVPAAGASRISSRPGRLPSMSDSGAWSATMRHAMARWPSPPC